jgi:O-antigen/teichoic acid export membrane protein
MSPPIFSHGIRFLRWLEVDRAVAYSILEKVWRFPAGLITLLLISSYLTPEVQGFYFTFISVLALQGLIELGFSLVITPFASHEWVHLGWDGKGLIAGEEKPLSRLISLGRLVFKWYLIAGILFTVCVFFAGNWFFSQETYPGIHWQGPWLVATILAGLQFFTLPFYAILEGCNQIKNVYLFRLLKAIFSALSMWAVMVSGGELWIVAAVLGSRFLVDLVFILGLYRNFFKSFISITPTTHIPWKSEVWPMQWRISLGAISAYFMFSIYSPILFHYHGPVVAGQFGMTWQVVEVLSGLASAWILPKVPRYSTLIAQKNYAELNRYFFRNSSIATTATLLGAIMFGLFIYGLNIFEFQLAERLLPLFPTTLLLLAVVTTQIPNCIASYLRSHKKDPLVGLNVTFGLTNGLLVWLLGSRFGSEGAATSYLAAVVLLLLPGAILIFNRCQREWHK